jgi:hypothetical protein
VVTERLKAASTGRGVGRADTSAPNRRSPVNLLYVLLVVLAVVMIVYFLRRA